jgi:hypothetical protein
MIVELVKALGLGFVVVIVLYMLFSMGNGGR